MRFTQILLLVACIGVISCQIDWITPEDTIKQDLVNLKTSRKLKGMQVQVSKNGKAIFNLNLGEKNEANEAIDNNTLFRIASVSKSFASVAILQLVQKGLIRLNQSLSDIFGYKVVNPNFPEQPITVEMVLSHQSSLIECQPYYDNFLMASYNAKSGFEVPEMKEILQTTGKYYNSCLFSKTHAPGTYYLYVNLNFGIAGTIVEKVSNKRFDMYARDNILNAISEGLPEVATFNPSTIKNDKNLGVIYLGQNGKWVPNYDNYPSGQINDRNMTGYVIGTNGIVFGPQGSLRASASHLSNYAFMLNNKGKTKSGLQVLSPQSALELVRPRYQHHGSNGAVNDVHLYGFGIFTTTYRPTDIIIQHEIVRGHTGGAYNLISAQHFWKDYTLTYIINGALEGYQYGTGTIYEFERLSIHKAVDKFIKESQMDMNLSSQAYQLERNIKME